jgi:mannosyltransferase
MSMTMPIQGAADAASRPVRDEGPGGGSLEARFGLLLAGALVAGLVLRLATISQQSLWTDEATTWSIVSGSLGHVLTTVPRTESTPPVYYVLLWLWTRIFGTGAFGLRSLSALCGVLTIWASAVTGRRLGGAAVGVVAAWLTSLSAIMVWYSQEARAYALVILLMALSVLLLLRVVERPSPRRLFAFSACAALALAVHYYAVFVVVPEAVWLLFELRRVRRLSIRSGLALLAPVIVVGLALLPLLIHQAHSGHASFIARQDGSLPQRVLRLVKQDLLGLNEPAKGLLAGVAGCGVLLSLAGLVTRFRQGARIEVLLPLVLGLSAVALAILAALAGADYVNTRNLLPTWPLLALAMAVGLVALPSWTGRSGLAALLLVSLVCVGSVILTPLYQRADWRGVAQALGPAELSRAIVGDRLALTSLAPYVHHLVAVSSAGSARVQEVDIFDLALQSTPPLRAPHPARIPGFRLVRRVNAGTFTLLSYRSAHPVEASTPALLNVGAQLGGAGVQVLLQAPQAVKPPPR